MKDFFSKPYFLAGLAFFLIIYGLSFFGNKIAGYLQTTLLNTAWLILFFVIFIIISSFFLGAIIVLTKDKFSTDTLKKSKKYFFRNLFIILLFVAIYWLINGIIFLFTKAMILASNYFVVSPNVFKAIIFLIFFAFLAGFAIFFTFSNFYISLFDLKLKEGIKKSFKLVKKEYPATLSLNVIFFVLFFLIGKIPSFFGDILEYAVLVPFFIVVLARFVLFCEK